MVYFVAYLQTFKRYQKIRAEHFQECLRRFHHQRHPQAFTTANMRCASDMSVTQAPGIRVLVDHEMS